MTWTCLLLTFNAASTAFASDCDSPSTIHPKAIIHEEVDGIWLAAPEADRVFFVLGSCVPKWRDVMKHQETVIDLSARVIRTSSTTLAAKDEFILELREHNDLLRARAEDAESGIDPAFAFMGGATVSALVAVVVLLVVKAVE